MMSSQPLLKKAIPVAMAIKTGQPLPGQSQEQDPPMAQEQETPMTAAAKDARKRYVVSMGRGRPVRSLFDVGSDYQAGKLG